MAEPKQRTNNSKQGMRRMHDKVIAPALAYCEKCHEPKEMHKVCYNCGTYNGKQVIEKKQ
ncbi:50S ribosomal protein L32 [Candidatus Berkelbacteria bacterium CG10_big_fil_rev_8_21_14_0_10_43_13]|uniref:Large ribosomal subunit protein bL32 n=1 Tax=Candidatus Berkelbacteria bacterium CG10_big_fil_rev_8_21_14_0_10_43_13 TaxID=1974514 RepID=A0A2H0W673_9BACT|nr:MAG: 50S ribosomal protein L32 [Candidatus Berkelbacteria bacterium CG10_big_fil_rev_8_21_14_0_10_43_13]